jgi:hypothetical protein
MHYTSIEANGNFGEPIRAQTALREGANLQAEALVTKFITSDVI